MREYTEKMRSRYRGASRREKGRLLEEFTRVTGYHRKTAVRLLSGEGSTSSRERRGRTPVYGEEH